MLFGDGSLHMHMHAVGTIQGLPDGGVQPEVEDGCAVVPCHPLLRPTIRRKIVCQGEAEADAVRVCRRDHLIEPLRMHVISDGSESWEAQDAIPHFKQSTKEGVMHAMLARTLECV